MAIVKPFYCIRPAAEAVSQVAALPYDVYSRAEAREAVAGKQLSFLNIDRPETQFPEDADMYSDKVYAQARKMLDDAGWRSCQISASNSLDEYIIRNLLTQGAQIDAFGVGERLITARSEPVFGGVYKLAAVEDKDGNIIPKIKISENPAKITNPHFKWGFEKRPQGLCYCSPERRVSQAYITCYR